MIRLWVEFQNKIVENGTISMKRTSLWWFFFYCVFYSRNESERIDSVYSPPLSVDQLRVFSDGHDYGWSRVSARDRGGRLGDKCDQNRQEQTPHLLPEQEEVRRRGMPGGSRRRSPGSGRVLRIRRGWVDRTAVRSWGSKIKRDKCVKRIQIVTAKSSVRSGNLSVIVSFKGGRSLNFLFYSSIFFK